MTAFHLLAAIRSKNRDRLTGLAPTGEPELSGRGICPHSFLRRVANFSCNPMETGNNFGAIAAENQVVGSRQNASREEIQGGRALRPMDAISNSPAVCALSRLPAWDSTFPADSMTASSIDPVASFSDGRTGTPVELPRIDDPALAGSVPVLLLPALLKIVPSYLGSFLAHTIVLVGLAIAVQQWDRSRALELNGALVVIPSQREMTELEVELEAPAVVSELEQLPERSARIAAFSEPVAFSGYAASELEGWDESATSGEEFALAAAEIGESIADQKAGSVAQGDARFFGLYANGRKFVFIIDCSGSMTGLRWNLAKAELKNSIMGLTEDKEFLVLLYNHGTWAMFNQDLRQADLVAATSVNKRRFLQWLSRQRPQGWTRPRVALEVALSRSPDAVFLLSDGELQDDSQQFLLMANTEREREAGEKTRTPVHTVALDLSLGAELLEQIAQQNSGVFTHIVTRKDARR